MPIRIIAEVGSTHMGKWAYCKELIDRCADFGLDAVKFQLFPNREEFTKSGNIWMPFDLFERASEYAAEQEIAVTASVFGDEEFRFLLKSRPPFMKFAYTQKGRIDWIEETLEELVEPMVSCDVMTERFLPKGVTKLFCVPTYPVYYQIAFQGLFPRFHGFSDHTLGLDQSLEALEEGAQILEKHITLPYADIRCPDQAFAVPLEEFCLFAARVRQLEKKGDL